MEKIIYNVTLADGIRYDLLLRNGQFAAIAKTGKLENSSTAEHMDGTGCLLLPPLVDAHAHLDKTMLGMKWFHNNLGPLLSERIANERESRRKVGLDSCIQAGKLIERSISMGTLAMRSHVDIDTANGLSCLEGVLEARERYRDCFYTELVAFPQSGLVSRPGTIELMEEALRLGADLVGGIDPAAVDRDPKGSIGAIFSLAEHFDKGVDIHLHEPGELGAFTMELIADHTIASGLQGRVTISHAFCLGSLEERRANALTELLSDAGIHITTGGQAYVPAVPSVKQLLNAGVNVCGGNDNVRDMWSPYGTGDMIERAQLIAMRNGFRRDEDLELALKICTENGAKLLQLEGYGISEDNSADFLLVRADNIAECVAAGPRERQVFKAGVLIAENGKYLS